MLAETHALLLNRLSLGYRHQISPGHGTKPDHRGLGAPADVQRAKAIIYQYEDKDFSLTRCRKLCRDGAASYFFLPPPLPALCSVWLHGALPVMGRSERA